MCRGEFNEGIRIQFGQAEIRIRLSHFYADTHSFPSAEISVANECRKQIAFLSSGR